MIFSIPIYVEERSGPGSVPLFIVRPLHLPEPVQRAEKLSRALARLTGELQQLLHDLGQEPRHEMLAAWTQPPPLDETTLELRIELASASHLRRFFIAGYRSLDRKLHFTPALPQLHFEVLPGQSLQERAETVLNRHFREQEKENGELDLDAFALGGRGRVTTIEIPFHPAVVAKKPGKQTRALLFGGEDKKDGAVELRRTGRLLQSMYPDDLDRAVGRDAEVETLAQLLASADRRPILLVGPRKVGKTAVLHELAWRMSELKKERYGGNRELWLVSPMRLISGMSFLGEWESRVLAIFEHVREEDKVLYFDDLPGLFLAGVSSASNLNVAQVLKPALEKRSMRILAEITPEAWRVLRERDRAFADLFHVLPVHEPPEPETLRVLINVARQLEERHRCSFDLDVVPAVFELHRRFVSNAAFPGKAAEFLRRLAVRHAGAGIYRGTALEEFREQTGVQIAMLDDRIRLHRTSLLEAFQTNVIGQDHALNAFTDCLVTLNARVNDSRRPLGVLLLLGPTGVGKTEAAKTLATQLFGSADRLMRYDMNEFVDAASASRLTGTPRDPEGLLTGAIRRQPFGVVLFDEIEKAAPEIFDLLLAVLDEGRLTDSLGQVADFTQSFILLTSNLGVREARTRPGFAPDVAGTDTDDAIYTSAAEKFFRPEFFNRLDRVIPFRALGREHLEDIAGKRIADVFAREGLRDRECMLNVSPAAMARLVELGHHPRLGARALKRVIEREVAQPLATLLAPSPPGRPAMANFDVHDNQFVLRLRELIPAPRTVFWTDMATRDRTAADRTARIRQILAGACDALDRMEAELEANAPSGTIDLSRVAPEHARYFFCREQWKKVDRIVGATERALQPPRKSSSPLKTSKSRPVKLVLRQYYESPRFDRQREAITLRQDLAEADPESAEVADAPELALLRELALLEAMCVSPADARPMLLLFRGREESDAATAAQLAGLYHDFLNHHWGASATFQFEQRSPQQRLIAAIFHNEPIPRFQGLYITGMNLRQFLPATTDTVLWRNANRRLGIVIATRLDDVSAEEAATLARHYEAAQREIETAGTVIQSITDNKTFLDFRTGLAIPAAPTAEEFRALILSALPLPPELRTLNQP